MTPVLNLTTALRELAQAGRNVRHARRHIGLSMPDGHTARHMDRELERIEATLAALGDAVADLRRHAGAPPKSG